LRTKGGDYRSGKRLTKAECIKIWERRLKVVSPELKTEAVESGDVVTLGVPYVISNVEEVTTEVASFQGIRVEMLTEKAEVGSIMLWQRAKVGKGSKLGSFIVLLGSNTDNWLNKWIVFKHWTKGAREIALYPMPEQSVVGEVAKLGVKASKKKKS
jgi:hypothetical protein